MTNDTVKIIFQTLEELKSTKEFSFDLLYEKYFDATGRTADTFRKDFFTTIKMLKLIVLEKSGSFSINKTKYELFKTKYQTRFTKYENEKKESNG